AGWETWLAAVEGQGGAVAHVRRPSIEVGQPIRRRRHQRSVCTSASTAARMRGGRAGQGSIIRDKSGSGSLIRSHGAATVPVSGAVRGGLSSPEVPGAAVFCGAHSGDCKSAIPGSTPGGASLWPFYLVPATPLS